MEASKPMQAATEPPVDSRFILPPRTRFQLPFPSALEQAFASFDDTLIAVCQRRTDGPVHFFSMALTFFTSIEFSLVAPPTLYALGYDSAAGLCSSVLLVLGIISQIPKKFIYRPRPWMVGRALPIRQDRTSSFPSRAVVCAVVFSWLAAWSLQMEGFLSNPLSSISLWFAILFVAALTAFARINVGAHYPSDTVLGFVLGCFVVKIGKGVEEWWRAACVPNAAHPSPQDIVLAKWSQALHLTSYRTLVSVTAISYAMTLISIQGFWVKCSYVYGLLMSSMAFRATYVCAGSADSARQLAGVARVLEHGSFQEHFRAGMTVAVLLIFGMLTRGKKGMFRIVTFSVIYFGALLAMLSWRLRPYQTEAIRT